MKYDKQLNHLRDLGYSITFYPDFNRYVIRYKDHPLCQTAKEYDVVVICNQHRARQLKQKNIDIETLNENQMNEFNLQLDYLNIDVYDAYMNAKNNDRSWENMI